MSGSTQTWTGESVHTGVSVFTGEPVRTGVSVFTGEPVRTGVSVFTGESVHTGVSVFTGEPVRTGVSVCTGNKILQIYLVHILTHRAQLNYFSPAVAIQFSFYGGWSVRSSLLYDTINIS